MSSQLTQHGILGIPRDAFSALHGVLFRDAGANAASYLQEAGYSAGASLLAAFSEWCASRKLPAPEELPLADFARHAGAFLTELGWGSVSVETLHDSAVAIDSADWPEANPASGMQYPGCYFSAGMLADFFGRIAGAQLVTMEVECRSIGHERCRFLVASAETIQHVYDGLTQGVDYRTSLEQMA